MDRQYAVYKSLILSASGAAQVPFILPYRIDSPDGTNSAGSVFLTRLVQVRHNLPMQTKAIAR